MTLHSLTDSPVAGHDTGGLPLDLRILRRTDAAEGVAVLDLAPPPRLTLPDWAPGAHIDVVVPTRDRDIVRQYSLCGPTGAAYWRIAVLLEPESRGGSSWLHGNAREGGRLRVTGLRNHFEFTTTGPAVFVAGGIGITPLLPMVADAHARGLTWELHYAGRTPASMAFRNHLAEYAAHVTFYPSTSQRLDVSALVERCTVGTVIYACGPRPLVAALEEAAVSAPVAVRTERFAGEDIDTSGDAPIEVTCARSGHRVHVPADRSILAALSEAGVQQVSQCEEGVCGSCETVVLDGVPEHRDMLLTDEERAENHSMMICVSRARTAGLTLDL